MTFEEALKQIPDGSAYDFLIPEIEDPEGALSFLEGLVRYGEAQRHVYRRDSPQLVVADRLVQQLRIAHQMLGGQHAGIPTTPTDG